MIGTCQTCGTSAPIEWFLSDTEYRKLCGVFSELPKPVQEVVFLYLSLFRPLSGRSLAAIKATRLITELRDLVKTGHVQYEHNVARPCPPQIWARAMEQMVERRETIKTLPLKSHIYMKSIAYTLADEEDYRREQAPQKVYRTSSDDLRHIKTVISPFQQWINGEKEDKPSDKEMTEWRQKMMER